MDVYGLKTCDACRKALKALGAAGLPYTFHDVRAAGLTTRDIARWAKAAGWERLLNKASTTWRALPDAEKAGLDEGKAIALMAAHPALVKRPVIVRGGTDVHVGWSADVASALGA